MVGVTCAVLYADGNNSIFELVAALLFMFANVPLWFSGEEKASHKETTEIALLPLKQRLKAKARRPFQPKKYPIECYSALTCLASLTFASVGIKQLLHDPSFGSAMVLLFGLMGMTPTLLQIFAPTPTGVKIRRKAKIEEAQEDDSICLEPTPTEIAEKWLAHNTEKLVGGLEVPTNVTMATAGFTSGNPAIAAAGIIYTAGYSFYAAFVRREQHATA